MARAVEDFKAVLPNPASNYHPANYEFMMAAPVSLDSSSTVIERGPRFKVISSSPNRNGGVAINFDINSASQKVAVLADPAEFFEPALSTLPANDYDMTLESPKRANSPIRGLGAKVWSVLMRSLLALRIKGLNCNLKSLSKEVAGSLSLEARNEAVAAELTTRPAIRRAGRARARLHNLRPTAKELSGNGIHIALRVSEKLFDLNLTSRAAWRGPPAVAC
jgi:hypothetical protein